MKILFVFIVICFGIQANTYSNDTIKSFIVISNNKIGFDDFSINYGHKLSDNYWIKLGIIYSGEYQIEDPKTSKIFKRTTDQNNFGILLGIDRFWATKMKDVDFIFGSNLKFNLLRYSYSIENPAIKEEDRIKTNNYYNFGLGFNFGLYYNFSENFSLGSEINPYIMYNFLDDNVSDTKLFGFTYKFNNVSIISLRYKW